jgi:ribosome-associated protein
MEKIQITTEFIKLDQLLKWANLVGSGSDAKHVIAEGMVKVNGEVETRRGKKIYAGDIVEFEGQKIEVIA